MQGIVDRIEDNKYVVILFESENKQIIKEKSELPNEICHADAIIEAELDGDNIYNIRYLDEKTQKRQTEMDEKRKELSEKLSEKD